MVTPLRILIIEDDLLIGAVLTDILEDLGHTVCGVAATEHSAVETATRTQPDLLIADARLASGSGMSAVEMICRTAPVPHFFVSGDQQPMDLGRALILQKPYTQHDLIDAIQRTMGMAADV